MPGPFSWECKSCDQKVIRYFKKILHFYKILLTKPSELEHENEYLHLRRLCTSLFFFIFLFFYNSTSGIAFRISVTFLEHPLSWQNFNVPD